jgi:uncharacterized protein involved in cysteine biosynthesis
MTQEIIRELIIIAGVNISLYLMASAYIDYKLSNDKKIIKVIKKR